MTLARGCLAALFALGCSSTTDSLGTNTAPTEEQPPDERPPPANTFAEVLGMTDAQIDDKIATAFEQLFYGDPDTEAIYFESGTDEAYIYNTFTGEIRTDGLAYGMMIAVQLDKPDEFARLWRYAQANNQYTSGAAEGYLYWACGDGECPDANGMQYAALALFFADNRWDDPSYAEAAVDLLDVMLHREELNGGVVDGVYNMFDRETHIVRTSPTLSALMETTTSSYVMPAFTELFAEYTDDTAEWETITSANRDIMVAFTGTPTGLPPDSAEFDGTPTDTVFGPEATRVGFNLGIDHLWHGTDWGTEVDTMLEFFAGQAAPYVAQYDIETGEAAVPWRSAALIATNGVAATAASITERFDFVQAVWDMEIPSGDARYYDGVLCLMSLIVLGGQFQIY